MKKFFAVIALIILTGCATAGHDEELLGTWLWYADGAYVYTFNYDGTGTRGFPETLHDFTWETQNGQLRVSRDDVAPNEIADEVWDYEIYEGVLTVINANRPRQDIIHTYVPNIVGYNPALVGQWFWENNEHFSYVFNPNGTGVRGFPDDNDTFTWASDDYRLLIFRNNANPDEIRGEIWTLHTTAESFTIVSTQEEGSSFTYIRN